MNHGPLELKVNMLPMSLMLANKGKNAFHNLKNNLFENCAKIRKNCGKVPYGL